MVRVIAKISSERLSRSAGRSASNPANSLQQNAETTVTDTVRFGSTTHDQLNNQSLTNFNFDSETPLPSIESRSGEQFGFSASNGINTGARTPSFSLTPPATSNDATPAPTLTPTDGRSESSFSAIESIDQRIGHMNLSDEVDMNRNISLGTSCIPTTGNSTTIQHQTSRPTNTRADGRSTTEDIANGVINLTLGENQPNVATLSSSVLLSPDSNHSEKRRGSTPRRSSSPFDKIPHDVASEDPPHNRFHETEFQAALTDSKNLVHSLINVLQSTPLHQEANTAVGKLYLQANELSRFQHSVKRIVGLVGDSGVGKSSLINSLLDCNMLARSSNSGAACTCVVTEYHFRDTPGFAIAIDYFTLAELEAQFTNLVHSYQVHHNPAEQALGYDLEAIEEQANVANDLFVAAFRDRLAISEEGKINQLLNTPESNVVQMLLRWARQSFPNLSNNTATPMPEELYTDGNRCASRLMQLSSEQVGSNEPSSWPFIRKIRVYLNSYILSKGLILTDLPGLRDRNSARVLITERYLLNCDEIFAVCSIGRATTDLGVKEVFDLAKKAKLRDVGIICTKTDDIRPHEAEKEWKGSQKTKITAILEKITDIDEELVYIENELNALTLDDASDDEDRDTEEEMRLLRIQRTHRVNKDEETFKLYEHLVNTRNQNVRDNLKRVYGDPLPDIRLKVFCVSNQYYWKYRSKPKKESMRWLQLSGVIALRKHCLSIVAESQLRAATQYIKEGIPSLLGSVELWIQSGAGTANAEKKQILRNAVCSIEEVLEDLMLPDSPQYQLADLMQYHFARNIYRVMGGLVAQWARAASREAGIWRGYHHSTYAAYCRHRGDYASEKATSRSWNGDVLLHVSREINSMWEEECESLEDIWDTFSDSVTSKLDLAVTLAGTEGRRVATLKTLLATLTHRKHMLLFELEEIHDQFQEDLSDLNRDAFHGSYRTAILGELLEPTYQRCVMDSGRGVDFRRKDAIQGRFGSNALFESLRKEVRDRFSTLVQEMQEKSVNSVATHLRAIQDDIDILKDENIITESESNPQLRATLDGEVHRARAKLGNILETIGRGGANGNV